LEGIGRQANLALRNAELYEIQEKYALHLKDMVDERTRELQSTQRMLIRSEKLASVGRLAASIAHEINNPLMPIKILLDDMLEDIQSGIPADAYAIEKTLESVERIRRVVDKLLEFTGKSPSKQQDSQQLDANRIIQNVSDLVRKTFEQEGKTITTELGEIPLIYGDKDGLEQVFMNMALNACEAMTKGGTLHIISALKDDHIVVTFSDTGCGIPHDIIETIFEPFFSTKDDGNGLGLFVSYGIIQNHQGNIEVTSEVDKGTTFSVSLPLTDKALAQA
jgi:two-component system NtrC family sensor kinase